MPGDFVSSKRGEAARTAIVIPTLFVGFLISIEGTFAVVVPSSVSRFENLVLEATKIEASKSEKPAVIFRKCLSEDLLCLRRMEIFQEGMFALAKFLMAA